MMIHAYINDEHQSAYGDRQKAVSTHLRELARKLNLSADRGLGLDVTIHEDTALEQQVLSYLRHNYGKIGDISMAHELIKLIRAGSQVWRG
jgi:hypothetical protein